LSPHAKPFVPLHCRAPEPEDEDEYESEDEDEDEDEDEVALTTPVPVKMSVGYAICQIVSFAVMFMLLWMFLSVSLMNQQQFEDTMDFLNTMYPQVVALSREAINWSIAFYWNIAYPQLLNLLSMVYTEILALKNHTAGLVCKAACG